jgi:glycosyltransferase involved in cell wall biosynthesis
VNVVSLSLCYPSERTPFAGLFVHRRLNALSQMADVRVINPIPTPPWSGRRTSWQTEGPPPCRHVPMPYLPLVGKPLNPTLYARTVRPIIASWSRQRRIDVIDAHFCWPDAVAANRVAREMRIPYAVTLRGLLGKYGRDATKRRSIIRALNEAAAVIAVSQALRQDAIRLGVDVSRIHVIPNGIDTAIFKPGDKTEARRLLGRSNDETILITVGLLCPRKGFHRVLEVLPGLARINPKIRYVIVGDDGAERRLSRRLRHLARRLDVADRVTFTGALEPQSVARWLQAADLFVLPTTNEGCCNALNEAIASGLPIVCTDVGGNRELVTEEAGRLVPCGDREALTDAIRRILQTTPNRRAVARAPSVRSWARVAEETAAVLRQAVCGSSRTQSNRSAPAPAAV